MDYYEKIILCGTVPALAWLGWLWRPLRGWWPVPSRPAWR